MAPNSLPEHRLGLSVGRRVGGAVVRTKLKRIIRESFRLSRPHFPVPSPISPNSFESPPISSPGSPTLSYDIVVSVRPSPPPKGKGDSLTQQDCQAILVRLVEQCHQVCQRRAGQASKDER